MRGTEKQVAWATDIIGRVVPVLEQAAVDIQGMAGNAEIKAANIARLEQWITALENAEYSGDVIAIFGSVRLSGNQEQDFMKILSKYRTTYPETQGMKKILCK